MSRLLKELNKCINQFSVSVGKTFLLVQNKTTPHLVTVLGPSKPHFRQSVKPDKELVIRSNSASDLIHGF
jgi:hypothetical protein